MIFRQKRLCREAAGKSFEALASVPGLSLIPFFVLWITPSGYIFPLANSFVRAARHYDRHLLVFLFGVLWHSTRLRRALEVAAFLILSVQRFATVYSWLAGLGEGMSNGMRFSANSAR